MKKHYFVILTFFFLTACTVSPSSKRENLQQNIHSGIYFYNIFEGPSFLMLDEILVCKTNPFFMLGYGLALPSKEYEKIEKLHDKYQTNFFILKLNGKLDFNNASPYNGIIGSIEVKEILEIYPLTKEELLKLGNISMKPEDVDEIVKNPRILFKLLK